MITNEFKAVQDALKGLPAKLQQKVVVGATRAAASVIAKEAKEVINYSPMASEAGQAPHSKSGLLKKSIAVRMVPKRKTEAGHVRFYVVPLTKTKFTAKVSVNGQSGKLKATRYAFYAHMVEFGTSKMAARPFLRPAYENSADKSVKAFQQYALKRTEKEIAKLAVR